MIRAAVIGLGWWGKTILKNLLNSTVIAPVLAVDPLDQARASASALGVETASRFEDALANSKVEAVILCTPQEHHAQQIAAAARSGRHVFCEKPLCTTAADAEAAIAAVKKAGVQLGIGHERRFEPAVIEMRKRFASGEFGNPLLLEGNFSQDKFLKLPGDHWRLSNTANPVGPLSGSVARATSVFAPSAVPMGAASVPRSVFTQPGCAEFTLIFVSRSSYARCTVYGFNAVFEASYANDLA